MTAWGTGNFGYNYWKKRCFFLPPAQFRYFSNNYKNILASKKLLLHYRENPLQSRAWPTRCVHVWIHALVPIKPMCQHATALKLTSHNCTLDTENRQAYNRTLTFYITAVFCAISQVRHIKVAKCTRRTFSTYTISTVWCYNRFHLHSTRATDGTPLTCAGGVRGVAVGTVEAILTRAHAGRPGAGPAIGRARHTRSLALFGFKRPWGAC